TPDIVRSQVWMIGRNAPGNLFGGSRHAPSELPGRKMRIEAMIQDLGGVIIDAPVLQSCGNEMKTELIGESKITSRCSIRIPGEGGRANQKETAGGDIIGKRGDFIITNGFTGEADH